MLSGNSFLISSPLLTRCSVDTRTPFLAIPDAECVNCVSPENERYNSTVSVSFFAAHSLYVFDYFDIYHETINLPFLSLSLYSDKHAFI